MSSHTILECDFSNIVFPKSKSNRHGIPASLMRNFAVFKRSEMTWGYFPTTFFEIRQRVPPSDDIIAHVGDIFLDISTNPISVYQNTSTGWTSCWSVTPTSTGSSKKEFLKLPHPHFKDRFLWSAKALDNEEKILSYITQEELDSRGGTEEQKQDFLREDLKAFLPITTAKTFVARRNSKADPRDTCLDSLDSSSSSLTMDAGNDSDTMYVEKDLCDDDDSGDSDSDDSDDGDGDDEDFSAEVVSGGESVDKANEEGSTSYKIAEITELAKTILEQVLDISYMTSSLVKCPASGDGFFLTQPSTLEGFSTSSSSTSYPSPKSESDSIHSLLSRLTAAIEKDSKERKEHLTKINNCG